MLVPTSAFQVAETDHVSETLKKFISQSVPDLAIEHKSFSPHVTLAKTRKTRGVKFEEPSYSTFINEVFGEQEMDCVELLGMDQQDDDGYYQCFGKLHFKGFELEIKKDYLAEQPKFTREEKVEMDSKWISSLPSEHSSLGYYMVLARKIYRRRKDGESSPRDHSDSKETEKKTSNERKEEE